jgi:hypothetical protein
MNAVLWSPILVATLTACARDAPDGAAETRSEGQVSLEAQLPDAPHSYVAEGDTIVLRLDMDRIRNSSLADEISVWLEGNETWGAALSWAGIDPVQDFDLLLAVAPTSDPAESVVFARHRLTSDRIRSAVGRLKSDGVAVAWRQVQGFDAARIPVGSADARVVVLTAPDELVVTSPALFDRVLRVASDQRDRRVGDELVEPALAFENGTIATVVAHRLNRWARERIPDPPPEAVDLRVTDDAQAQGRVHVHANGTYRDPAAAAAAGNALTERRDFYASHMLVTATGLNGPIGESEIQADGNELDVRSSFTEGDIERVIGMVAMMRQFGR